MTAPLNEMGNERNDVMTLINDYVLVYQAIDFGGAGQAELLHRLTERRAAYRRLKEGQR